MSIQPVCSISCDAGTYKPLVSMQMHQAKLLCFLDNLGSLLNVLTLSFRTALMLLKYINEQQPQPASSIRARFLGYATSRWYNKISAPFLLLLHCVQSNSERHWRPYIAFNVESLSIENQNNIVIL